MSSSMRTLCRLEDGDAADGTWSLVIPLSARGSESNSRRWILGRLLQAASLSPSASSHGRDRSRLARASQPPFVAILLLPSMSAVSSTFRMRMNVASVSCLINCANHEVKSHFVIQSYLAFREVVQLIPNLAESAGLEFGCATIYWAVMD